MRILDWQICRIGSPVLDLSMFFMTSTTKELRDFHYNELIAEYYASVSDTIRICGSDPERLFSFEHLQHDLRKYGKFGLKMAPFYLSIVVCDPSKIESAEEFTEKFDANATQPQTVATFDARTEALFKKRLGDVIHDSKEYGYVCNYFK